MGALAQANRAAYDTWVDQAMIVSGLDLINERPLEALLARDQLLMDSWVAPGDDLQADVLTIMGENDRIATLQGGDVIRLGAVRVLPGAGRDVFIDRPDMTMTAIARFLEQVGAQDPQ